ncbi:ABC transporter permease subunit [Mangrovibacillus sp. Mu-81]|uniref:ABC transporter permease n=1 Tax=Mangrovibacillus sp. Mu-81 TaxID=3121478 RepID=UPI002FE4D3EF
MGRLLIGEWKKLKSQKIILMVALAILTLNIGCVIYMKSLDGESVSDNWKEQLAGRNVILQENLEKYPKGSLMSTSAQKEMLINEYRLSENVKPMTGDNIWSFVYFSKIILSFAGLLVLTIASRLVSSEHQWKTIQTLMVKPIRKSTFITSKILTLFTFTFFTVSLQLLVSLLLGSIFFGIGGEHTFLSVQQGSVGEESFPLVIIRHFFLSAVSLFVVAMIGLTLSTIFRNTAIAMAVSLFLYFTSENVTRMIAPFFEEIKYTLFANTDLNMYFNGSVFLNEMTFPFSVIVLSFYLLLFITISIGSFVKREV